MTIINSNQGNVKQSEVGVDTAQPLLQTGINEDALTVVTQLSSVLTNALRRLSMLLLSDGIVTWNGTNIGNSGSNILLKINQRASGGTLTITIPTAYASTFSLTATGDILMLELDRTCLEGADFTLPQTYANLVVVPEASTAALQSPQSPTANDPTAYIPIVSRYDNIGNQAAYWPLHGIYWPQNTSSPLGAVLTSAVAPIGTVIDYFPLSNISSNPPLILGYSSTKAVAPGYQLCNGSIVIDSASPFANPTRNTDGTPNGGTNFNLDTYTPNLNGNPPAWNIANAYNVGDYVENSGTYYVAIQNVPASGPGIGNLTYWVPETNGTSGFNDLLTTNPNNRYRWTTTNQGINSFTRGKTTIVGAGNGSAYGGAASFTFLPNLGNHVHYMLAHTHGTSAVYVQMGVLQQSPFQVQFTYVPSPSWSSGGGAYFGALGAGAHTFTNAIPLFGSTDGPSVNNTDVPINQNVADTNTVPTQPPYINVLKMIRIF